MNGLLLAFAFAHAYFFFSSLLFLKLCETDWWNGVAHGDTRTEKTATSTNTKPEEKKKYHTSPEYGQEVTMSRGYACLI
jgi:hypothetical protein